MPSRQPFQPNIDTKTSTILIAVSVFASVIIVLAILYFLYCFWYSLVHRSRTSPFDGTASFNKLQRFSYKELENATNNFAEPNSIGKGGSGTVFRGILKDGKLVAVKLLDSASFQFEQEFQNELKILGGLQHCPQVVTLLGYCMEKSKRLVVYEYMPNKSLQECLFSEVNDVKSTSTSLSLDWSTRFRIILDVAKALAFLHLECDPPVIHGDVKPSNVLLDTEFKAKLSDFGLSRLKLEGEFGVDIFSQEFGKSQELSGHLNSGQGGENETPPIGTPVESHDNDEVDFALALQASSSSKNSCKIYHSVKGFFSNSLSYGNDNPCYEKDNKEETVKGKEMSSNEHGVSCEDGVNSTDHSKELKLNISAAVSGDDRNSTNAKQWGKDWWWRQDGSGELCSKDYVMEWIGSQISPSADAEWEEETKCEQGKTNLDKEKSADANVISSQGTGFECLNNVVEKEESMRWKVRSKQHRKMQEWWKEENLDELSRKTNKGKSTKISIKRFKVPHFGLGKRFHFTRRRKCSNKEHNVDDPDSEFSFRKGSKRKNSPSMGSDMWSGDLFSRELSSTTSMRGTLCYVAPEYGGCGYLMEKADIYSFGVLILVIVSGRRPLHVLPSPMKLEKANLINWSRQLAQAGNVLELVDEKLKGEFDKDQASLCISLALACLQKIPELRPDIGDVVKILKGEVELPPHLFEFSPSPPSKLFSRSRRKQNHSVA